MSLRPFFSFYGSKWRHAKHYPMPAHDTIVEPFAGAAGYALRHYERQVVLVDIDPKIVGVWRYLLGASSDEIVALPDVVYPGRVDELTHLPDGARWLIGFWLNRGCQCPVQTPGKWMREGRWPTSFWGPFIRERIASQLERIRHWKILEGSYKAAPDVRAVWFIDPPYQTAGKHYMHSASRIDFADLARFCRSRRGQTIVCEAEGAGWLPFEPFMHAKATTRAQRHRHAERRHAISKEAIWVSTPRAVPLRLKSRRV